LKLIYLKKTKNEAEVQHALADVGLNPQQAAVFDVHHSHCPKGGKMALTKSLSSIS